MPLSPLEAMTPIASPDASGATASGSAALGYSMVSLDTTLMMINVSSTFLNLNSSAITMAHFHYGTVGMTGGVALALSGSVGATNLAVPAALIPSFLNGSLYINVHTAAYPRGELRGQVAFTQTGLAVLSSSQEVPSVTSTGYAFASVLLNDTTGNVTVSGLYFSPSLAANLANTTGLQIQGPAAAGSTAAVVCNLVSTRLAAASTYLGATCGPYNAAQLEAMRQGSFYLNILTAQNPTGELRGQIFWPSRFDTAAVFPATLSKSLPKFNPVVGAGVTGTGAGLVFRIANPGGAAANVNPGASITTVAFLSASNLTSSQTAAHLHATNASSEGPYIINMPLRFGAAAYAPLPMTPSRYADLSSGATWFNVHTPQNPAGEVAGSVASPVAFSRASCPSVATTVGVLTSANLTSLVAAIGASPTFAGLLQQYANTMGGVASTVTVFAPTNAAFASLLAAVNTTLLAVAGAANGTLLTAILLTHTSLNFYPAGKLPAVVATPTSDPQINLAINTTALTVAAPYSTARILTPNAFMDPFCGVAVHVIDTVLLPVSAATAVAALQPSMVMSSPPPKNVTSGGASRAAGRAQRALWALGSLAMVLFF